MQSAGKALIRVALLATMVGFAGSLVAQPGKEIPSLAELKARETWRMTMHHTPAPKVGCFHASFPATQWQEVQCAPPNGWRSVLPRKRRNEKDVEGEVFGPGLIPHNNDIVVQAPSGHLFSSVVGSFPVVNGVQTETDPAGIQPGANEYSLQLNTNDNYSGACGSFHNCVPWEQFVMATNAPVSLTDCTATTCPLTNATQVFIEYWLLNYGTDPGDGSNICPSAFTDNGPDQLGGAGDDCVQNSPAATIVNGQLPITGLAGLQLSGSATAGGNDEAKVTYNDQAYTEAVPDSYTQIASVWNQAEFNVVGSAGGSEAEFNDGSAVTVQIAVTDGSTSKPACVLNSGTTGESNNLTFVPSASSPVCCSYGGSNPSIEFIEAYDTSFTHTASCGRSSIIGGKTAACVNGFITSKTNGKCICPSTSHIIAGKCIPIGQCPAGDHYDALLKKCVRVYQEPPPPNE